MALALARRGQMNCTLADVEDCATLVDDLTSAIDLVLGLDRVDRLEVHL